MTSSKRDHTFAIAGGSTTICIPSAWGCSTIIPPIRLSHLASEHEADASLGCFWRRNLRPFPQYWERWCEQLIKKRRISWLIWARNHKPVRAESSCLRTLLLNRWEHGKPRSWHHLGQRQRGSRRPASQSRLGVVSDHRREVRTAKLDGCGDIQFFQCHSC